jgi:cytochrome bd-type quinol oxidase subunit 2
METEFVLLEFVACFYLFMLWVFTGAMDRCSWFIVTGWWLFYCLSLCYTAISCFCHLIFTKRNREKSFYFVFSHSCFLVFAFNFPLSRFRFVTTKSRKREMTTPGYHFSLYILGMNRWIRNNRIVEVSCICDYPLCW